MMKKIRKEDGLEVLVNALFIGDANQAIYDQEARGQQALVESDVLPAEIKPIDRKILENAGVIFGDTVADDSLFQYVTLPTGWQKVPTDHSMWSALKDERGRTRAMIFYKAAFYDRRAHCYCKRRYSYGIDYEYGKETETLVARVWDMGNDELSIFSTVCVTDFTKETEYEEGEKLTLQARDWLDRHYPKWEDAGAYWEK